MEGEEGRAIFLKVTGSLVAVIRKTRKKETEEKMREEEGNQSQRGKDRDKQSGYMYGCTGRLRTTGTHGGAFTGACSTLATVDLRARGCLYRYT